MNEDDEIFMILALEELEDDDEILTNKPLIRNRMNWEFHVQKLEYEGMFNKKYRMSINAFNNLVQTLRPHILHESDRCNSIQEKITIELMVSATIRLLAGGSYLDIYETHGVTYSYLYRLRDKVLEAILKCPSLKIRFPEEQSKRDEIRVGFMQASNQNLLHKCWGVLDGLL